MKKLQLSSMNFSGAEVLSKDQMKNVMGKMVGGSGTWSCECSGSVGSWTYTSTPSIGDMIQDIQDYCSSGEGTCTQS